MAVREKLRLHWLLLLVAVTAVAPSNANYSPNQIKSMVQKSIAEPFIQFSKTQDYPGGTQFAVLALIPQQDYANGNTNIQLYPAPSQMNIDNRYPVQPRPQDRVNYMVARPDTPTEAGGRKLREHAEKKLLDNLKQLLQNFERHYGPPAMVLLYTRFTPCTKCTEEILGAYNVLREKYDAEIPFTVTYSIEGKQASKRPMSKSAQNIRRLQDNGINVVYVNMNGGQGGGGHGGGGIIGGGGFGSGGIGGGGIGGRFNFGAGGLGGRQFRPYSSTSMNNLLPRNGLWNLVQKRMIPTLGGPNNPRPSTSNNIGSVGNSPLQPNIYRPYAIQTGRWSMLQNRLPQRRARPTAGVLSKLPFFRRGR